MRYYTVTCIIRRADATTTSDETEYIHVAISTRTHARKNKNDTDYTILTRSIWNNNAVPCAAKSRRENDAVYSSTSWKRAVNVSRNETLSHNNEIMASDCSGDCFFTNNTRCKTLRDVGVKYKLLINKDNVGITLAE